MFPIQQKKGLRSILLGGPLNFTIFEFGLIFHLRIMIIKSKTLLQSSNVVQNDRNGQLISGTNWFQASISNRFRDMHEKLFARLVYIANKIVAAD